MFTKNRGINMSSVIVQYIVVRGDLKKVLKWSTGALIAQACHATAAVTHLYKEDLVMKEYLADLNNMHKIVLEAPDEESLRNLESALKQQNIDHKVWMEQPENIPTCLVVKPYPKDKVGPLFKKLKLFKDD